MTRSLIFVLSLACTLGSASALADSFRYETRARAFGPDFDGYDDGWRGAALMREGKLKWRTIDGCEVEQKWEKREYKETVKCKRPKHWD